MIRALVRGVLFVLPLVGFVASPADAGNIALTGHDDDFHCSQAPAFNMPACNQLKAMVNFARSGSPTPTLQVLSFDSGSQLTAALTFWGIPFTNVDPNVASNVTDALFNPATYSAFVVASDESCVGCDNTPAGEANIRRRQLALVEHVEGIAGRFDQHPGGLRPAAFHAENALAHRWYCINGE